MLIHRKYSKVGKMTFLSNTRQKRGLMKHGCFLTIVLCLMFNSFPHPVAVGACPKTLCSEDHEIVNTGSMGCRDASGANCYSLTTEKWANAQCIDTQLNRVCTMQQLFTKRVTERICLGATCTVTNVTTSNPGDRCSDIAC
jgi:hypothetical protein